MGGPRAGMERGVDKDVTGWSGVVQGAGMFTFWNDYSLRTVNTIFLFQRVGMSVWNPS